MKRILLVLILLLLSTPCWSATYFIRASGGNNNNTGLSYAQGWSSVSKVNGFAFLPGDDVYFECGGVWQEQLRIHWSGVDAANPAIVGAFYMSGGSPVYSVSGNKPQFKGKWPTRCQVGGTGKWYVCPWPGDYNYNACEDGTGIPASPSWMGMVSSQNNHHVIIQDLSIIDSGGPGMDVGTAWNTLGLSHDNHIYRCDLYNLFSGGIFFSNENMDAVTTIQGGTGRSSVEYCTIRMSLQGECSYCEHSGAGLIASKSRDILFAHNTVNDCAGEAIGIYNVQQQLNTNTGWSTIEHNTVYNIQRGPLYVAGSHNNIIRYNVVYGMSTDIATWWGGMLWGGTVPLGDGGRFWQDVGIMVGTESIACPVGETNNNWIYGNFIANSRYGIGMGEQIGDNVNESFTGNKFYNNTIVDCETALSLGTGNAMAVNAGYALARGSGNEFKNNIIWVSYPYTGYSRMVGESAGVPQPWGGITFDYNLWTWQPEWVVARGAHDPVYSTPSLQKTTGWTAPAAGSITKEDFRLQSGSSGINNTGAILFSGQSAFDAWGTAIPQATYVDLGAHEFISGAVTYCGDDICNGSEVCGTVDAWGICNHDCGTCPASDNPIIDWNFDTAYVVGTNVVDQEGADDNATLTGSPSLVAGKNSESLQLDGSTQYATLAAMSTPITTAMTASGWFRPDGCVTGNGRLFSKTLASPDQGWFVTEYDASRAVVFFTSTDGASDMVYTTSTANSFPVGTWTHVTVTADGSTNKIYINGVLNATTTNEKGTIHNSTTPLALGQAGNVAPSGRFHGLVDDVVIYARALNATEVAALYAAKTPGGGDVTPPHLAIYSNVQVPAGQDDATFVFTSDEAGVITVGGDCTGHGDLGNATIGQNTIIFSSMDVGTHTDCTVLVTDASSNASDALSVGTFTISKGVFDIPTAQTVTHKRINCAESNLTIGVQVDDNSTMENASIWNCATGISVAADKKLECINCLLYNNTADTGGDGRVVFTTSLFSTDAVAVNTAGVASGAKKKDAWLTGTKVTGLNDSGGLLDGTGRPYFGSHIGFGAPDGLGGVPMTIGTGAGTVAHTMSSGTGSLTHTLGQ